MLPAHFVVALQELQQGVEEIPGSASNPRIGEYLQAVGLSPSDETPWCSAFANWCMTQSGVEGSKSALARSWLKWGVELERPTLGCVVVVRRGSGWQGHVGFFVDAGKTQTYILGGNQSNRVCVASYPTAEILGYRR